MQHEILNTYNQILNYSFEIKAAIEKEDWERVDVLASHREELFQITNAFIAKNTNLEKGLKTSISTILKQIKEVDDKNFEAISKSKLELEGLRKKIGVGQKALSAYQNKLDKTRGVIDKQV